MIKNSKQKFAAGLMLAAACSMTAQGQTSTTAAETKTTGTETPASDAAAKPTQPAKSAIRFEGTDLHLGKLPPITFHGFASQGFIATTGYNYLAGETKEGSFDFNEFGINASMNPLPRTRIAAQGFMFDLGNVGNYHPVLDYGLIDYNFCDQIGVRGGRIRRPSGIYNQVVDIDMARTFVLLPQGVYNARWRDFYASLDGGSVYGNFNLGKAGSLSYEAYAGQINLASDGGIARDFQDRVPPAPIGHYDSVQGGLVYGGQLWYNTPVQGLRAGLAIVQSDGVQARFSVRPPYGPGPMHYEIDSFLTQYSVEYAVKSWTFQAEGLMMNHDFHTFAGNKEIPGHMEHDPAWYVSAAYRFNKWFETGLYYTEAYRPDEVAAADKYQRDLALALRFDIKPWWLVKLEGHVLKGTALVDSEKLNPVHKENPWYMLAVKTTISF